MGYTAQQIIDNRKRLWQENGSTEQDKLYINAVAKEIIASPELRQEISEHPEYLIEMCFQIVDKEKKSMPFFLNEVQADFIRRVNKAKEEYSQRKRLNIRFIILKGRQAGFTTCITAYQLASTITQRNFEGFTAADEEGNTSAIFENKGKYVYSLLPETLKPTEKYNNKRQLLFEKLHSSWEVKTASKNMGRSRTINFFHGSEAAFWRDGISGVQAGLGEALTKDAVQILESTANGYNEYKDLWDNGEWENCFYEWWRTSEYRHEFENESRKKDFQHAINQGEGWIYERCRWLIKEIKLDWEQVFWYHNKYKGYINKDLIKQEYPCSPDEAFLASGECIFDKEKIIQHKERLTELYKVKPPMRGEFIITWADPDDMLKPVDYKWQASDTGFIKIYEDVKAAYPYVLAGDTKGEGSDRFAGTVINNNTGKRAATLHGNMKSKYYAAQMWALGMYYNTALIGIETNFNTYPVELLDDWHYPRQYQREIKDNFTGQLKKAYGFRTDGNTRPLIIEKEITLVEERIGDITDVETLNEMLTFVKDKNGRPDAESGKHDDVLFSDMIGEEIRSQQTHVVEVTANADDYDDDDDDCKGKSLSSFF